MRYHIVVPGVKVQDWRAGMLKVSAWAQSACTEWCTAKAADESKGYRIMDLNNATTSIASSRLLSRALCQAGSSPIAQGSDLRGDKTGMMPKIQYLRSDCG